MAPPGDKPFVFIGYNHPSARVTPEAKGIIRRRALILARQAKLEGRSKSKNTTTATRTLSNYEPDISVYCKNCPGVCKHLVCGPHSSKSRSTQKSLELAFDSNVEPLLSHCKITDPFGALLVGGIGDLAELGQWYFHDQVQQADHVHYDHAIARFSHSAWELAKHDEITFNCVIASVLRKRAYFLGGENERMWLMYKGRILSLLQKAVDSKDSGHDSMLIVAIAMLVTFDIGDRDFAAAKAHLEGLRRMIRMDQLTEDQWLYVTFTDLRFSLLLGAKPIVPYYIPPSYRSSHPTLARQSHRARQSALYNSRMSPRSKSICSERTFDIFRRLHEIGLSWPALSTSERLPLGEIYALEYQLLSSCGGRVESSHTDLMEKAVELVMLAAHLQVLVLSRYWTRQRHQTPMLLLHRAMKLIVPLRDLPAIWSQCASSKSLLWILFILTASMLDLDMDLQIPVPILGHLRDVVESLRLQNLEDFVSELRKWPWAEEWHLRRAATLWDRMQERDKGFFSKSPTSSSTPDSLTRKLDRLYIGTFQFYTPAPNT